MPRNADADRPHLPVELTVNGRAVAAPPGQTILELVREQHLDTVPTLCHEPGHPPFGSCFLCVVEVKDARGLLPSCTTRVRDGMEVVTRSDRITRARKTALALLLSDHYADCACPGQLACPAGVDVQGYLGLAKLGHYREALRLIRERNPLPVVCGRVCVRKCEAACRRNLVDESVGINQVKRFVSGHASVHPERLPPTGKRVAVVGGGPAGLSCAYYLTLQGHAATIHEAMPRLGGMLRYGIPAYRLPREELDADIDVILGLGVEVACNRRLGREFTLRGLREEGFHAIFLAPGAPLGKKLGVPGEDARGIESALDFLRDTELHGPRRLHGKVVVVGGGNSAVDAARTAVRCGAEEVTILYRRSRKEMPAFHEEVDAAEQEGVRLATLVAPVEAIRDAATGRLAGIRCVRMELGEPDRSGRRRPLPVEGSEFEVPCSFAFSAVGQAADPDLFSREPEDGRPAVGPPGTIEADAATMACRLAGVFAGGDAVNGPAAVIDAVAQGRLAAEAIDGYLRTGEVKRPDPAFVCRRDDFGPVPETLVVADYCWTRTARAAQVVFPASTLAETDGNLVRFDGTLYPVEKGCSPPGGRTTAEMIRDLAREIGCALPLVRPDATRTDPSRTPAISLADAGRILVPRTLDIRKIRLSGKAGLPVRRSYATMNEAVRSRLAGREMRGAF